MKNNTRYEETQMTLQKNQAERNNLGNHIDKVEEALNKT